ncbi:hypothetical protein K3162_07340 [Qipengyuania xiapuensis]|uniref:Polyketide cyclase / dehydrase and lipid transport n=1 Tax=Qipengyuania xiapuensis TaxID=2867236 RepID=A0ABX8ZQU6_9SPHN|nr:hypothetical protein [Qipengyuania xiapuensis]QZD91391.1 hypothetical protein K3162_07340 [Qipengyuania xiapuensis]
MIQVTAPQLPPESLLARRRGPECYRDAFRASVTGEVSLGELITAFFSSRTFLTERMALHLIGRGAGHAEIAALAAGRTQRFAAWEVEAREEEELLMHDFLDKTCCWLAVSSRGEDGALDGPLPVPETGRTYIWFGTAVREFEGPIVSRLRGAHRWYARHLLEAAARRLG